MSAIKRLENRILYIDFGVYKDYRITEDRYGYTAYQIKTILGPRRRFETPEKLQKHIDDYFQSCIGPALTRGGVPVIDNEGNQVYRVTTPLTMSGLARHLGVTTRAMMDYKYQVVQRGIPEEFLPILNQARQRIEEYSETRLYDTDGSKGAQFALAANFGWETPKERSERKNLRIRTKLAAEEQRVKLATMEKGDGDGSGLQITIVRAGRKLNDLDAVDGLTLVTPSSQDVEEERDHTS